MRRLALSVLIGLQVFMLVVLNVFDYSLVFPSRSGMTVLHQLFFCLVYFVALVWGSVLAFRHFHWTIGVSQVVAPALLWTWLSWPVHYDPQRYQFLVGKTSAEVTALLGTKGLSGYGNDDRGIFTHYKGMLVRFSSGPKTKGSPEPDDRVISVEPNP